MIQVELDKLARSCIGPFAFCGLAVSRAGQNQFAIEAAHGIKADRQTMFRVASISKIVVGQTLLKTARSVNLNNPLNADIADILGRRIRNPHYPNEPITLRMIASHTSGLRDVDLSTIPDRLSDLDLSECFRADAPGAYFSYSNLGYVILAAAIEALSGERLDAALTDVLKSLDMYGGFNWAGVTKEQRHNTLPTYRRDGADLIPQIDGLVPETGIGWPRPLETYDLTESTWAFSPQGGLRTSLHGMLQLAKALRTLTDEDPLWSAKDTPGETLGGVFEQYGCGLQIFDHPSFYPNRLIGHFGTAYGFKGGVWFDCKTKTAFAYALNGADIDDERDDFAPEELRIFEGLGQLFGV